MGKRTRRGSLTIKAKIWLFAACTIAIFSSLVVASLMLLREGMQGERIESLGIIGETVIAEEAARAVGRGDKRLIAQSMQDILESTEICKITVWDSNEDVFFSKVDSEGCDSETKLRIKLSTVRQELIFPTLALEESRVVNQEVPMGEMEIVIDAEDIGLKVWASAKRKVMGMAIVVLLIFIPVIGLLTAGLVRPLRELMAEVKRHRAGDDSTANRRFLETADEYGELSRALYDAGLEIKRRQTELEQEIARTHEAKQAVEEANRRKESFLSAMATELKVPTHAIHGSLGTAGARILKLVEKIEDLQEDAEDLRSRKGELTREAIRALQWVELSSQSIQQIKNLADELGSCVEDEEKLLDLVEGQIELGESLNRLIQTNKLIAAQKGLDLHIRLDTAAAVTVKVDWQRLSQSINVLLSNAIRHTKDGNIYVDVSFEEDGEVVELAVEIMDEGCGMSGSKRELVEAILAVREEPIGNENRLRGLQLAQSIMTMMGGRIEVVKSEPGKGSVFRLAVRLQRVGDETWRNWRVKMGASSGKRTAGLKVLHVDRSLINQMLFREICEKSGCDVLATSTLEESINYIDEADVDLVVVDASSGFKRIKEVVSKVKEGRASGLKRVTLLAMVDKGQGALGKQYVSQGFDDYLEKPYAASALATAVERMRRVPL